MKVINYIALNLKTSIDMKTIKKKVDFQLQSATISRPERGFFDDTTPIIKSSKTYEIIFHSDESFDPREMEIFIDVQEPETLSEFLKDKGISKKELVTWLNENY